MMIPSDRMAVGAFDESNAFSAVRVQDWMSFWQCRPPILAMHVWKQLPLSLQSRVLPRSYVYPRYLRLAMGHSHSVHILMSINITSAGRAFHAARLLLPKAQEAPEPSALLEVESLPMFHEKPATEAARREVVPDDDSTCAPSLADDSCGDVYDDGWESDLLDESWREIHAGRASCVDYERSSTGKSLD